MIERLHPRLVRQGQLGVARAEQHRRPSVVAMAGELGGQPGLAGARLTADQHDLQRRRPRCASTPRRALAHSASRPTSRWRGAVDNAAGNGTGSCAPWRVARVLPRRAVATRPRTSRSGHRRRRSRRPPTVREVVAFPASQRTTLLTRIWPGLARASSSRGHTQRRTGAHAVRPTRRRPSTGRCGSAAPAATRPASAAARRPAATAAEALSKAMSVVSPLPPTTAAPLLRTTSATPWTCSTEHRIGAHDRRCGAGRDSSFVGSPSQI